MYLLHGHPGLREVEHEPVPVVVVPRILVVEVWGAGALVLCAQVPLIPLHNDAVAVRVQGRHQEQDDVVQYLPHLRAVP